MAGVPRQRLLDDDDDPPEYTALPLPEEASIDAGAGAPIVRVQPPHLIINPSDPRSQFARHYHAHGGGDGGGVPPPQPRLTAAASGPVPMRPRLPPRTGMTFERQEPVRIVHGPAGSPGAVWGGVHGRPPRNASTPQVTVYTVMCPVCRNSGLLFHKVPCSCPAGRAKRKASPRGHSSSLLGFIDDMLGPPQAHDRPPPGLVLHSGGAGPLDVAPGRRSPPYLQFVPGPGAPCPNCLGQSYFRNAGARNSAAAEEIRAWHGRTPPPCSVCCDRGRIN
ncbi:hypothetical protein LPJ61_000610 [Coemansia biformis]|uniref:Uncharacterized protein n=1 Tax=Coemansia biformis TaxID=1286918 RepID=A0A9W8D0W5_9FUNG|nr:hypothetical protein LPJ61_000610 [Coemansia biformis]